MSKTRKLNRNLKLTPLEARATRDFLITGAVYNRGVIAARRTTSDEITRLQRYDLAVGRVIRALGELV